MGWEERNGHKYYYYKKRVNGRVKSIYAGRGEVASMVAVMIETTGGVLRVLNALDRADAEALERLDDDVDSLCALIGEVTRQALLETGHYQHKGQWRKRRNGKQ